MACVVYFNALCKFPLNPLFIFNMVCASCVSRRSFLLFGCLRTSRATLNSIGFLCVISDNYMCSSFNTYAAFSETPLPPRLLVFGTSRFPGSFWGSSLKTGQLPHSCNSSQYGWFIFFFLGIFWVQKMLSVPAIPFFPHCFAVCLHVFDSDPATHLFISFFNIRHASIYTNKWISA